MEERKVRVRPIMELGTELGPSALSSVGRDLHPNSSPLDNLMPCRRPYKAIKPELPNYYNKFTK